MRNLQMKMKQHKMKCRWLPWDNQIKWGTEPECDVGNWDPSTVKQKKLVRKGYHWSSKLLVL